VGVAPPRARCAASTRCPASRPPSTLNRAARRAILARLATTIPVGTRANRFAARRGRASATRASAAAASTAFGDEGERDVDARAVEGGEDATASSGAPPAPAAEPPRFAKTKKTNRANKTTKNPRERRRATHAFLSRTTLLAAALVVYGSVTSPWPAVNGSADFTFKLMKRLFCVFVARKIAAFFLTRSRAPAVVVKRAMKRAKDKFDADRQAILLIPVVAAFVGWFTNWLAVKMIFYPITFLGVALAQKVEGELWGYPILNPLGVFGWQGIVPAKAAQMAHTMVTMVTTKLIDVQEVFMRLNPDVVASLLSKQAPSIAEEVARDVAPNWVVDLGENALPSSVVTPHLEDGVRRYLSGFVRLLQRNVDRVIDLKELVVVEMCEDKRTLVELFRRCGREELKFLVNSGLFFGFLLGCVQAGVWLFYDNPWTLTIGGTIVGLATNWIALKCIFEPIEPYYLFGNAKLKIQGLFLQRQTEVSGEFSDHLASKVLTSEKIWDNMLQGDRAGDFEELLEGYTRDFVTSEAAYQGRGMLSGLGFGRTATVEDTALLDEVVAKVKERLLDHVHVLHEYTDDTLALKELMRERMALMTPREFERVLHPIFEQDELTLIISGAVLGAIAGFAQQVWSVSVDDGGRKKATSEPEREIDFSELNDVELAELIAELRKDLVDNPISRKYMDAFDEDFVNGTVGRETMRQYQKYRSIVPKPRNYDE